jgi:predicted nucleic acid-binding protein
MINFTYVVDASVFLASMQAAETHHADALTLLNRIEDNEWQTYLPMIALPEIGGNLARNSSNSSFAQRLLHLLRQQAHITLVPVDEQLGSVASDLAIQQRIRGCDAVYVALAQSRRATLITLDQEQIQRAPPGLVARTPGQELALLPPPDPEE